MSKKNEILWLEDNTESIIKFVRTAQSHGLTSIIRPNITTFASALRERRNNLNGIILDLMIYGARNLAAFNKPQIICPEFNAGISIFQHVLREPDSDFTNIPVVILSVRPQNQEINRILENYSDVIYIQKSKDWETVFNQWLKTIRH